MTVTLKGLVAAAILTGFAILGIGGATIASADMNINATGGSGTAVDKDGTQGTMAPAVQGTQDSDNDQDAWLHPSTDVTPQYKAK
ncbi:MAG: hypothetical protein ACOYB7_02090 [Mycobacterium sp.]